MVKETLSKVKIITKKKENKNLSMGTCLQLYYLDAEAGVLKIRKSMDYKARA